MKKSIFAISPIKQNFSIQPNILHYILTTSNCLKLLQTCKYFFNKYSFIPVYWLRYCCIDSCWKIVAKNNHVIYNFTLPNLKFELSITHRLEITWGPIHWNLASSLCHQKNRIRCNFVKLSLGRQILFFDEFLFLTSSKKLKHLNLRYVSVINHDGSLVQLETLFLNLPSQIKTFIYYHLKNFSTNSKTSKAFANLPHFENLREFTLNEIPETFDLEAFSDFLKKQTKAKCVLNFCENLSENNAAKLNAFIYQEIIQNLFKPPPLLKFPGIIEKYSLVLSLLHGLYFSKQK